MKKQEKMNDKSQFCLARCGRCAGVCNKKKNHTLPHKCPAGHSWNCVVCGGTGKNEYGLACSACHGNG